MKLAIYGKSCTGKSAVSKLLAANLNMAVRHCGDLVKERAQALGCSPGELGFEEHEAIDSKTRELAQDQSDLIIEGCFLPTVLEGLPGIRRVKLICERRERERRWRNRNNVVEEGVDSLTERDGADKILSKELFKEFPRSQGRDTDELEIDTTRLTVREVCQEIYAYMGV